MMDADRGMVYEIGYAEAMDKPILLIAYQAFSLWPDTLDVKMFYFDDFHGSARPYIEKLREIIKYALENPRKFISNKAERDRVFISYSHKDTEFLERLLVHLKPLAKEGLIDLWVDTMLKPGDEWKVSIQQALTRSQVAILLISADFLASEFILENELPPLLEKSEKDGVRIIPIIIKPCRYTRDKRLSHFQAINDPATPLAMLSSVQQENIFDKVAVILEQRLAQ